MIVEKFKENGDMKKLKKILMKDLKKKYMEIGRAHV